MAEGREDSAGRTEQPTPRRLEKAREDGMVARAHGAAAAAVLLAGAAVLSFFGAHFAEQLALTVRLGLLADPRELRSPDGLLAAAGRVIAPGLEVVASVVILLAAVGFVADILVGGWIVSARPLVPDPSRINPIAGLGRLFSRAALAEIVKALVKFGVVGAVAVLLLRGWADRFLQLAAASWPYSLHDAARLWSGMFIALAVALCAVAALEAPYQLWEHRNRLKMTRQEVKDELRELDGSPQTKRRIRALRRRLARMRMMAEVEKADVVVTNPDHYAAALSYREGGMRAPRLVAKGTGLVALRIGEIAGAHGVAIVAAPPLARAICRWVELGDEIPAGLYPPVAEVLAYVHSLRIARAAGRPPPPRPQDRRFEPPAEFAA
ncbi:MAG TPA: EscU/YscU/HrcU family type III secretion system export apparatus switch protein [Stellaceae bacterium]|nr:EscU/YscU/HrcU family type III secretion system export apparatus switch protein [Stellaceae bacterium]